VLRAGHVRVLAAIVGRVPMPLHGKRGGVAILPLTV